jgi:hypothetical protein
MDPNQIFEYFGAAFSILLNLGLLERTRRSIIEKIKVEVLAGVQPIIQAHKKDMDLQNQRFDMIIEVLQESGQVDAEKIRLMILNIENIAKTQEKILQRIYHLEHSIH